MRPIPDELLHGSFTRRRALALGVSKSMFAGQRFVRVHPGVWRHRDHDMSWADEIAAARSTLPVHARPTHVTRIQMSGLDFGPRRPLHFVVQGELHLALDGIFLHRTKQLAPCDDIGVTLPAAFIAYCSTARMVDAIVVVDWLLHHGHMTIDGLVALAGSGPWRAGADEAVFVSDRIDGRSRSIKESETRAVIEASGLVRPEVNHPVHLGEDAVALGDLVFTGTGLVVEYQGAHHQTDRDQYNADIERFALFRDRGVPYLEVTNESLARPKTLVGTIFRRLVSLGYDGAPPTFGDEWRALFRPIHALLPPRRTRPREVASGGR
jgi:hypothetical protein